MLSGQCLTAGRSCTRSRPLIDAGLSLENVPVRRVHALTSIALPFYFLPAIAGRRKRSALAIFVLDQTAGVEKRGGANLRFLAYNTRFLIPPWVAVPHLASHLRSFGQTALTRLGALLSSLCGTFVDPERFRGTPLSRCWDGRWDGAKTIRRAGVNRSIKAVLGHPLTPRFRELLQEV